MPITSKNMMMTSNKDDERTKVKDEEWEEEKKSIRNFTKQERQNLNTRNHWSFDKKDKKEMIRNVN